MPKKLFYSIVLTFCILLPRAHAEYQFQFPDQELDSFDYDYPYMNEAGDVVVGLRSTPDLPSVNYLYLNIQVGVENLHSCSANLRFFFDGFFVGTAEIIPSFFSTTTFSGERIFQP